MNKKQIIIGTTSINRPSLHLDNIPFWYKWLISVDKNLFNLTWFINIDCIEKLHSSVEETKQNFMNIIKDIKLYFYDSDKGNFLQACKTISFNIEKYVLENCFDPKNVIIIWLEDDWKLNNVNIPLQTLIENYLSNLTLINLSFIRQNYIHALAPSIITYELWSKLNLDAWKNQNTHIDPERCVGLYFIKNFNKYEDINNITVISNKKIDEIFFEQKFLNYEKSLYTYNDNNNNNLIMNNRYIKKDEIKDFCKDKITFIRITNSLCFDCGRNFMKNNYLIKNSIQNEKNIDFYK